MPEARARTPRSVAWGSRNVVAYAPSGSTTLPHPCESDDPVATVVQVPYPAPSSPLTQRTGGSAGPAPFRGSHATVAFTAPGNAPGATVASSETMLAPLPPLLSTTWLAFPRAPTGVHRNPNGSRAYALRTTGNAPPRFSFRVPSSGP